MTVNVTQAGYLLVKNVTFPFREPPKKIVKLAKVVSVLVDSFSYISPGNNNLSLGKVTDRARFMEIPITINFGSISSSMLILMAEQFKNLPLTLSKVTLTVDDSGLTGIIVLSALGS